MPLLAGGVGYLTPFSQTRRRTASLNRARIVTGECVTTGERMADDTPVAVDPRQRQVARAPESMAPPVRRRWVTAAGPTALDVGLLTGFWLLFFWQILVARDRLIPYDLIDQHYMFQAFIQRALDAGAASWWAPQILGGYPIVADPLTALFYPPNLLMHALTRGAFLPYYRLETQLALHFLWAALGTYALARALTGSRAGALIAALTYAFGGFFAWHVPHLSPISSLSWLPWVLFCYTLAVRRRSLLWTALAAGAFGMLALAGHALTILQAGYLVLGIATAVGWRQWRLDQRRALGTAVVTLAVLALGAGLAAAQLLSSWELGGQTERASYTFEAATGSSYLPHWAVTALLPNYFAPDGPAPYWGSGDIAETNMYAGLLPLLLAALAVARARRDDRRMVGWLLAGAVLALVLAFGSQAWLYRIAFDLLPGVDRVRRPLNFIALVQLALGVLAAYGVRTLQAREPVDAIAASRTLYRWLGLALLAAGAALGLAALLLANAVGGAAQGPLTAVVNGIVFAGVVLLAAWAALRGRLHWGLTTRALLALLVLIAAVDLGSANAGKVYKNFAIRPADYIGPDWAGNPNDPTVRFLLEQQRLAAPERFRILPVKAGSIWENGPLVWGLESAFGYSVLWPLRYQQLYAAASSDPNSPLFDLLNIRYIVTSQPLEALYPGYALQNYRLVLDGATKVYENLDTQPRAWMATQWVAQPPGGALAWLRANGSSLRDVIVLDEPAPAGAAQAPAARGAARITRYENTRVTVRASSPAGGFLVLADTNYPGWRVTIDGEPAKLYSADSALRAVWVPAGEHDIEFRYTSSTLRAGVIVSLLAAFGIGGLFVAGLPPTRRGRRRDRRRQSRLSARA